MGRPLLRILWLAAALLTAALAWAEVAVPPLSGRVVDQTQTLTPAQLRDLEQALAEFERRKGVQIAVLLVPTTGEETIEQYGIRVAEAWRLGRRGVDDGLLLLVAKQDRTLRIEVGYGLEGVIPDAIANRVIDEIMVPRFQAGDFYGGTREGLARLMGLIEGEPLPPPQRPTRAEGQDLQHLLPIAFFGYFVLSGILGRLLGRLPGALATGGVVGGLIWLVAGSIAVGLVVGLLAFFFALAGGGRGVGGFYGGRGGGGFGGGLGGGGFRGGGGGFGGGGASGRW